MQYSQQELAIFFKFFCSIRSSCASLESTWTEFTRGLMSSFPNVFKHLKEDNTYSLETCEKYVRQMFLSLCHWNSNSGWNEARVVHSVEGYRFVQRLVPNCSKDATFVYNYEKDPMLLRRLQTYEIAFCDLSTQKQSIEELAFLCGGNWLQALDLKDALFLKETSTPAVVIPKRCYQCKRAQGLKSCVSCAEPTCGTHRVDVTSDQCYSCYIRLKH
jgi:hypothetical protein